MNEYLKKKKRKKILILIIVSLVLCSLFIWYIDANKKDYYLTIDFTENCNNNDMEKYYIDFLNDSSNSVTDRKYYTRCIDNIIWHHNGEKTELKEALEKGITDMNEIVKTLDKRETFRDGGSVLYRDRKSILNKASTLTILVCNTLEGNQDFYFGNKDMEYENGFCDFEFGEEHFDYF